MAKNDYFVLAYRILKYLYACFMAGEPSDLSMYGPDALGINNGCWVNVLESLSREGYIIGVDFPTAIGTIRSAKCSDVRITQAGIVFLQENSQIAKAAEFLRTIKETIPGL